MRILCLSVLVTVAGLAQQTGVDPPTRAAEIEAARDAKSAKLAPDTPTPLEQRLIWIKDQKVLERISAGVAGVRLTIGGMTTASGFALGPDYLRQDLARGEVFVNAGATASTRRWLKLYASAGAPSFANDKLFFDVNAVHHNYNSIPYYGPGPDSEKFRRTNFRLEDTSFDTWFGAIPHRSLRVGGSVGYQLVNTGPGLQDDYASSDRVFPNAAGMARQTDFFRTGVFAQFDYRDNPFGARAGGSYMIRFDNYSDRDLKLHDFRKIDLEVQQYIPLFNKRRVIALHGKAVQAIVRDGQRVPFYHQAVLGGADDLRGFRPFRFWDDNLFLMNAEYRWEVFSGLDMALFADAGKVSPRRWDFAFSDLETAVGFGFRFNARNSPFLRLDVGFSHEGFQIFLKFNGIFTDRPQRSSSPRHIY